ncbi:MAG TPA: hypothetical protein VFO60_11335 [Candidatus Dormibacteraeota bacterium]|nr:hypothetical protein [Candidatus Dormibacteraeota bacterium]
MTAGMREGGGDGTSADRASRQLFARIGLVEKRVEALLRALTRVQTPAALPLPPWSWALLDDEGRRSAWSELVEWVDWWVRTYELEAHVPRCWASHGDVVEHLIALRWAHREVWAPMPVRRDGQLVVEPATGRALIEWHLVAMPGVLEAIRRSTCACGATRHDEVAGAADRRAQAREAMWDEATAAYDVVSRRAATDASAARRVEPRAMSCD